MPTSTSLEFWARNLFDQEYAQIMFDVPLQQAPRARPKGVLWRSAHRRHHAAGALLDDTMGGAGAASAAQHLMDQDLAVGVAARGLFMRESLTCDRAHADRRARRRGRRRVSQNARRR